MKRLLVLAVVLVVMVSSVVRANGDPDDPTPKTSGVVVADDVSLNPPPGSDIDHTNKPTPILF